MITYINEFNIDDDLIENRLIQRYIIKHYNNGKVYKDRKHLEDLFYTFKMDCICLDMSYELYNLIRLIYKTKYEYKRPT